MASDDKLKVSEVEIAKAIIAHEAVNCFRGREKVAAPKSQKLISCTGGTFWGKPGEAWPVTADDEPLIPWLQIVCTEMKDLYGAFYKRKAVCFYIREEFAESDASSLYDNGDFVVREYSLSEKLVPLVRHADLHGHPFHPVIWEEMLDYPSLSKYFSLFDRTTYRTLCDIKEFEYANRSGIKIGGWPTPVQSPQKYPETFDLQIDMTKNFMYGDSGIGFLSKRGAHWHVIFECC